MSFPPAFLVCCLLLFFPLSIFLSIIITGQKAWDTLFRESTNTTTSVFISEEDDADLLRRAALSSPDHVPPAKIAFMFLTTTSLPFAPLWQRFFTQKINSHLFNVYIHADPTGSYASPFTGVFADRVIPSAPTRRSHHSLISAARRLLAYALLNDSSNAMFALLSPSCVPLRSFRFVYRTLTNCSTKSFIEILAGEPEMEARYNARGRGVMMPYVPFDSFRVGSQFFVLARRHAVAVAEDTRLWARFRLPCESDHTCYPEEHYFPTLLHMRDPRGCVPATLTHVNWTGSVHGHPRTYTRADVGPGLIAELRAARPRYGNDRLGGFNFHSGRHPFLFARKFAPECLKPLMRLAHFILRN